MEKQYSGIRTIWKGTSTFLKVLAGVMAGLAGVIETFNLPADWTTFRAVWPTVAVPLALAIWRMIENVRKNVNSDGTPAWKWPWSLTVMVAILVLAETGCVHTGFQDSITNPDGTVSSTKYRAISMAWPLGKIDTTGHQMGYTFGNSQITIGQDAAGIDNSGQVALINFLQSLVVAAGPILQTMATKPGPVAAPEPKWDSVP